jgi:alcohol dehydrogenase (cytochrome c)
MKRALLLLTLTVPLFSQVTFDRILNANKEPQNWLTYSGTNMSQRYSLLTQINPANAANLEQVWKFTTASREKFEATPLVVDGTMYTVAPPVAAAGGRGGRGRGAAAPADVPAGPPPPPPPPPTFDVMALDAVTGTVKWTYSYASAPEAHPCCGRVNRGLAILGTTLFMGTTDAHIIALDAKSGQLLWNTKIAEAKDGYALTHAPLVIKDKVIMGTAGGEYGIRGFIAAYDVKTGKEVWRFHTIPEPGEPGHDTWAGDSWMHGAASVWASGSYDPETNLTFWGTGNAGPDFNGDGRLGDNLYANSVVALDADTGKLKWHYQFSPHDERDWDATQVPVLADITYQGRPRKVMMWANRNGVFYTLDRTTGQFLVGKAFTTINWLAGFTEVGRPIWADGKIPKVGGEGVLIYPGVEGGTSWYSPSFSPRTGWFYVSAWDNYHQTITKGANPGEFKEGAVFGGGGGGRGSIPWNGGNQTTRPEEDGFGAVRAIDPATGERKWEYKMPDITMAGVLTTATDVLFSGSHDGSFFALNARTGAQLWKTTLAGAVYSGAMTYSVNGKQYIAVSGGNTLHVFALK